MAEYWTAKQNVPTYIRFNMIVMIIHKEGIHGCNLLNWVKRSAEILRLFGTALQMPWIVTTYMMHQQKTILDKIQKPIGTIDSLDVGWQI